MAQPQVFKLGYSSILVKNDEFGDGYTNGLVAHPDEKQPLTVEAIRKIIDEAVIDVSETEDWNTGYIVGAVRGILEGDYKGKWEPNAPRVQCGSLTLHLNRWRFRDGYYNGQRDYEVSQEGQPSTRILTANELLRYLAHHDPQTNRYYFGEEDLSGLEDVLGQLVGYLCAALRPSPAQEHDTEPLPMTVCREA